jgi:hypothetical protein
MTREELYAKLDWGTDNCAVEGCNKAAAFLVEETWDGETGPDWWEYRCEAHARQFAEETGIELPAGATDGA